MPCVWGWRCGTSESTTSFVSKTAGEAYSFWLNHFRGATNWIEINGRTRIERRVVDGLVDVPEGSSFVGVVPRGVSIK